MTDCAGSSTKAISNLGVPVCELIRQDNLTVSEKIDGCGSFVPVPFTLTKNDPNLGAAPTGFQYVKIETNGRYQKGVSVEYRFEISGDYNTAVEPIVVKAGTAILTFDCGCFLVPVCQPPGKLSIIKECSHIIINNQATLNYNISVNNLGETALTDVLFQDVITIPIRLSFGTVTVVPPTLTVDTSTPSQIKISGNLGTINSGGQVLISYTIPIIAVSEPGEYVVSNTALVSATGTQSSANCSTSIKVVMVDTQKCCGVTDINHGIFRFTISSVGLSPDILVDVFDNLFIHGGATVRFTSFGDCIATFSDTGNPVPINTDISGPTRIRLECRSLLVPQSGTVHKDVTFTLVSSSAPGIVPIENEVETVVPVNPDNQIFLGAGILPAQAGINVQLSMACQKPCV